MFWGASLPDLLDGFDELVVERTMSSDERVVDIDA